jgi:hypothetical protein
VGVSLTVNKTYRSSYKKYGGTGYTGASQMGDLTSTFRSQLGDDFRREQLTGM